ncbi:glycosyl hydrolase family 18 protein [uncultured Tenacibaculum sp.]|uniref:glycosyl hydrolase family 18 protein n=1 Tax=uncultured Tenacibaculum sp. TaxID=174713 RepID=UPI00262F2950|nr:glycosyl hydrolase family 18 protein [uncultured Tenacibaculum sp.]
MTRKFTFLILFFVIQVQVLQSSVRIDTIPTKEVSKLKKKKSKIGKFIQSIFHHNDSAKQARKFIHQHHKVLKDKKSPTFAFETGKVKNTFLKTSKNFALNYEVFGWYPYWEKDYYKHINFSLLSTVAYFSYEVNPKTGDPITTHDWETIGLIDSIQAQQGKKVLLTVSNFGIRNNRRFLKNSDAIDKLVTNLIVLLAKRNADGICIDFEGVSKNEKSEYTSFLLNLSNRLKSANDKYKVYVTVPNVNWSKAIDFKAINQAIDCFVIMGYDYYGKGSKVAGPVAPLTSGKTWEPFNLTNSVKYYTEHIPSSKIILALPTYGSLWETKNLDIKSKVKKYIGSRTFSYIKTNIEKNEAVYIEPISKSAYSVYKIKGSKNVYRQCWFENDESFKIKTKLIKDQKLRGLGLWALGYDRGYNDFWEIIRDEFAKPIPASSNGNDLSSSGGTSSSGSNSNSGSGGWFSSGSSNTSGNDGTSNGSNGTGSGAQSSSPSMVSKVVNTLGLTDPNSKINKVEKKLVHITNYKTILLYVMCFVLFFACVGFIIAIISPNTRNNFFNNSSLKKYYTATVLLIAIVVFRMQGYLNDGSVILIIGFVLGVYTYYLVNKLIDKKQKDLP